MISRVEDIPTKGFAYLSLARLRQPDQTPFLIDALKRARYLLRPFVALALGIQGDAAGRSTLRKYIHRYRNDDSYYSAGAIALGLLKDKQFVGGAIARLRDRKDPGYKPYWMSALGLAADRSAVPVLIEQFKQRPKSWEVRYAGTVSLLALGNSEPLKILPGARRNC
jgi:HEAT repeat protein